MSQMRMMEMGLIMEQKRKRKRKGTIRKLHSKVMG
jgi:hypothetical protein